MVATGAGSNQSRDTGLVVYQRFSISAKLMTGFLAVLIAAALVGFTGLYFVDRINESLNNITDFATPTVETSDDLIAHILEAKKVAIQIVATTELTEIAPLTEQFVTLDRAFGGSFDELQEIVSDETLLDKLDYAKESQREFVHLVEEMTAAHRTELELKQKAASLLQTFDATAVKLIDTLEVVANEHGLALAKAQSRGLHLVHADISRVDLSYVLDDLFLHEYPTVEAALRLQRLIMEIRKTASADVASSRVHDATNTGARIEALSDLATLHLARLAEVAVTSQEATDVRQLSELFRQWVRSGHGTGSFTASRADMIVVGAKVDTLAERTQIVADTIARTLDGIVASAESISNGADEAAAESVRQAQLVIAALLTLGLAGSLGASWLVIQTVVRPVRHLTNKIVSLSAAYGQSNHVPVNRGDEIETLNAAFASLQKQVRLRTADLQQQSAELNIANSDLEEELVARRALEDRLVRSQKLEGLGTLAGGIAHDFNNMLYVILGCTRMALEDAAADSPVRPHLDKIDIAAKRSSSIVNQLLFFSRKDEKALAPVDIAVAVEEAMTLLRVGLPSSVTLDVDKAKDRSLVLADEGQIQQIAVNLVTNAFQAYGGARGVVKISVAEREVELDFADRYVGLSEGPHVVLAVEDNAGGIPDSVLPNIFDPFFTTKSAGEGTGLGLAVVQGIVKAHGGTIIVDTTLGEGTKFEVYLPVAIDEAGTGATQSSVSLPCSLHERAYG